MTKRKRVSKVGLKDQMGPEETLKSVEMSLESKNEVKTQFTEQQGRIYPAKQSNNADVCSRGKRQHFQGRQPSLQGANKLGKGQCDWRGCRATSQAHHHFLHEGCYLKVGAMKHADELQVAVKEQGKPTQKWQSFKSAEASGPRSRPRKKATVDTTAEIKKDSPNTKNTTRRSGRFCPHHVFGRDNKSRNSFKARNSRECQTRVRTEFWSCLGKTDISLNERFSLLNLKAKMERLRNRWLKLQQTYVQPEFKNTLLSFGKSNLGRPSGGLARGIPVGGEERGERPDYDVSYDLSRPSPSPTSVTTARPI